MKVIATIYKGIEYVQVSLLPAPQRELISQEINPELFIKILVDDKVLDDCLQYKDYVAWFDSVFVKSQPPIQKTILGVKVASGLSKKLAEV